MSTRAATARYRLKNWAKMVQDRESSGQTIKAYCENIGIAEHVYYHRLRKVREAASGELAIVQSGANSLAPSLFAKVRLPESPTSPLSAGILQNHICIEIAGVRLTAGSDYPIDKLTGLLQAVSRSCY